MAQSKNGMNVFDLVYPIGSIYLSVSDVNPAALFGGSWERITDRFLLGAGGSYSAGATGGEASHTLTVDEMPSHYHDFPNGFALIATSNSLCGSGTVPFFYSDKQAPATVTVGGSGSHNNMPPYLAVYIWKRIS